MEKAKNVVSVEANFQWSDLGSWSSMREVFPIDDHNNAIKGNVATLDSYGNVLVSDEETLLGLIGMNGVAVIKSGNGVLVCPLAEEQKSQYPGTESSGIPAGVSLDGPSFLSRHCSMPHPIAL